MSTGPGSCLNEKRTCNGPLYCACEIVPDTLNFMKKNQYAGDTLNYIGVWKKKMWTTVMVLEALPPPACPCCTNTAKSALGCPSAASLGHLARNGCSWMDPRLFPKKNGVLLEVVSARIIHASLLAITFSRKWPVFGMKFSQSCSPL